jgi:hypothetical protein
MDIDIESLRLDIDGAAGHEHRIRPIASQAAEILAARLQEAQERGLARRGHEAPRLSAGSVQVDLSRTSNEAAARSIAAAWMNALTVRLGTGGSHGGA